MPGNFHRCRHPVWSPAARETRTSVQLHHASRPGPQTPNSATDVPISWSEATDNIEVTGYTLYRDGTPVVTTPNTSHVDSNLTPETTYIYTVKAHDAADNSSGLSTEASGTTLASTDTTSPTVNITSPSENDIVSGMVTISGTASDNIGVVGVQFQLDGANLGAEDTTNDYSVDWDTSSVTPGTYTLTAIARDAAGNTTTTTAIPVEVGPIALEITNLQVQSGKAYVVGPDGLLNGALTYIDRSYTFTTIPPTLTNTTYIQTGNNDKSSTGSSFMSFDVNQPVTVYVAHDDRITPKPTWLNSFTNTGDILITSDTDFEIYSQTFPTGTINLGGNRESGKGGSMYSVAIMSEGGPTADTTPPSIPSILSAVANSSTQATISWEAATDNTGVTGYNVYRDAIMISTTTDLNYVDSGLTPFTSYSYTIQAIDEAGNVSALSSATSVTTEAGDTNNNNGTAQLSWQKNPESDLSHYVVYYGTTSQVYDQIIPVGLTQTPHAPSYTITGLALGTSDNKGHSEVLEKENVKTLA